MRIYERIQEADWRKEKHVPVIECPDRAKAGEGVQVKISLGKAIGHPNTTEHHIRWIKAFFSPDGDKFTTPTGSLRRDPTRGPFTPTTSGLVARIYEGGP